MCDGRNGGELGVSVVVCVCARKSERERCDGQNKPSWGSARAHEEPGREGVG